MHLSEAPPILKAAPIEDNNHMPIGLPIGLGVLFILILVVCYRLFCKKYPKRPGSADVKLEDYLKPAPLLPKKCNGGGGSVKDQD